MIQATTAKVAQQTELKPLHNNIDMNKFEYLNGSGYRYKLGSYVIKGNLRKHLHFWKLRFFMKHHQQENILFSSSFPFCLIVAGAVFTKVFHPL